MRTCQNCGNTITCGCQDRIASDGKLVCSSCVVSYEHDIIAKNHLLELLNSTENENPSS